MSDPAVSVVVVTRNRAPLLRKLLASLAAQRGREFEVVVVDDASTDSTAETLRDESHELELRPLRLDRRHGPAGARNAGWRAARAPVVAFVDDDCETEPGWLEALAAAVYGTRSFGQGRTVPDPRGRLGAFTRSQSIERAGPWFQTCNIAYPRELLERLGGFDESFEHFGEDTDLGWRALEAGADAVFVPEAVARHAVHPGGALDAIRGSQRWADPVKLVRRHPGLRRELVHGVFWKRSHERLLLAAAGTLLARRTRGLSLLLALPYLADHRRVHGSAAGLAWALPAHLAVDLAELVAVVRGSARHRTLVL